MEAKELMQFDWVCLENDPTPRQVDFIRTGEVGLYWNKIVTPPYIKPIPLTPEILEKNGFRKSVSPPGIHAKCYEIDDKDKKYCLTVANYNRYKRLLLNVDSEDSECFNIKCDYVHELQHALRLCGIEKEIIL